MKIYNYPRQVSFIDIETNAEHKILTELYKCSGLYVAAYVGKDTMPIQLVLTPKEFLKLVTQLQDSVIKKEIKNLRFGNTVGATKSEEGFWLVTEGQSLIHKNHSNLTQYCPNCGEPSSISKDHICSNCKDTIHPETVIWRK